MCKKCVLWCVLGWQVFRYVCEMCVGGVCWDDRSCGVYEGVLCGMCRELGLVVCVENCVLRYVWGVRSCCMCEELSIVLRYVW